MRCILKLRYILSYLRWYYSLIIFILMNLIGLKMLSFVIWIASQLLEVTLLGVHEKVNCWAADRPVVCHFLFWLHIYGSFWRHFGSCTDFIWSFMLLMERNVGCSYKKICSVDYLEWKWWAWLRSEHCSGMMLSSCRMFNL